MATSKASFSSEQWDGRTVSLNSWIERLEEYFVLEDITDGRKKVAASLTYIGSYGYEIFKSLLAPDKPSSKEYDALKKLITEHITPKPVTMVERHKFSKVFQGNKLQECFGIFVGCEEGSGAL